MDIKECIDILHRRNQNADHTNCMACSKADDKEVEQPEVDKEDVYSKLSPLELVSALLQMQHERVQVYKEFDDSLTILLDNQRIEDYAFLCAEVTARFQVISSAVKKILVTCDKQALCRVTELARGLQNEEREKLTLVAALHLEIIRDRYPQISSAIGGAVEVGVEGGSEYVKNAISVVRGNINRIMEDLQAEKVEMMEEN